MFLGTPNGSVVYIPTIQSGLVTLAYRSLHSFMRPSVRMPRGFCRPAMNGVGVDCRTH